MSGVRSLGRQAAGLVSAQGQDQRPPLGGLGVEEDGVHRFVAARASLWRGLRPRHRRDRRSPRAGERLGSWRPSVGGFGGVRRPSPNAGWRVARGGRIQAVELGDERFRVGTQGTQPVDEEAPQPGIGAVLQERPEIIGVPQPEQGHRAAQPAARPARP